MYSLDFQNKHFLQNESLEVFHRVSRVEMSSVYFHKNRSLKSELKLGANFDNDRTEIDWANSNWLDAINQ